MRADEFRTGALSLVRGTSDAFARYLTGHAELGATLSWITAGCAQLRNIARDETSQYLIGLIDRAVAQLQARLAATMGLPDAIDDSDSSEIVLAKALWELEVHLARMSLVH